MKKENGITLIALIITIIILTILTAVIINLVFSNNGIFEKSKTAKLEYEIEAAREKLVMKIAEVQTEKEGQATLNDLKEILEADSEEWTISKEDLIVGKLTTEITIGTAENVYIVSNRKYEFRVNKKLEVKYIGIVPEQKEEIKVLKYKPEKLDDKILLNNVTVDEDGIVTLDKNDSYMVVNNAFNIGNNTWEISTKFKTDNGTYQYQSIIGKNGAYNPPCVDLYENNGTYKLNLYLSSNNYSWDICNKTGNFIIQKNKWYWLKLNYNGEKYELKISEDGINYITDISVETNSNLYCKDKVVFGENLYYSEKFYGQIDIKETYIKNGNEYLMNGKDYCEYVTVENK